MSTTLKEQNRREAEALIERLRQFSKVDTETTPPMHTLRQLDAALLVALFDELRGMSPNTARVEGLE